MPLTLPGNDNYSKPRQNYADRISAMTDEELLKETESTIWLSAYANNNPRSDYHWQADACTPNVVAGVRRRFTPRPTKSRKQEQGNP